MTKEKTVRGNGKWAKIAKSPAGKWTVAKGYAGELKAREILSGAKDLVEIIAESWVAK